jgi:hypothetical protein
MARVSARVIALRGERPPLIFESGSRTTIADKAEGRIIPRIFRAADGPRLRRVDRPEAYLTADVD